MEKIVILKRPSEKDDLLISCLRILFPECEIEVQSGQFESPKDIQTNTDLGTAQKKRNKNAKHFR